MTAVDSYQVQTTLPVMNWAYCVTTSVPLVLATDTAPHQALVLQSLINHFLFNPGVTKLVGEMVVTQMNYPLPFAIRLDGYQSNSVRFSSMPYMQSMEAEVVLIKLGMILQTLAHDYRPPRRKTVWDWLRVNLFDDVSV